MQCSTEREEWFPIGHRFRTDFSPGSENQGLARFVRDREWCPVAITNSLCVNRVRVSQRVNTAESLLGMLRPVLAGTRCYTASTLSVPHLRAGSEQEESQESRPRAGWPAESIPVAHGLPRAPRADRRAPEYLKPRPDPTLSLLQMSQGDLTSREKRRLGGQDDATRTGGGSFRILDDDSRSLIPASADPAPAGRSLLARCKGDRP